jgi:hypothetical protein
MKNYPLREADYSSCVELADVALRNVTRHPDTRSKEMEQRRVAWSHAYKDGELRPLCYEHHTRMTFGGIAATSGELKRVLGYFCAEPGCSVGYDRRNGYFMMTQRREYPDQVIIPCVSCPRDGRLMYLAQIKADMRSFRLWRCPLCETSRTNREALTP